ncbi:hypothetical protein MSHOH_2318 [Methanosarcina horonobensis HB-1 = JCM 15518]|uniref:Uncharacterized protein n=1 Tax=Methanosarcina horonobensis HB-1 = JCM 15518 TaxID=1434110 RepID=A0A0E3SD95_9EURY|nr:hypothetical protein [Methanosarcina horonobensis]AKB78801.1 hypothetical protein MSHOH_2318 [Methanosarcina horonobensis HB-1 = JCM 15518]
MKAPELEKDPNFAVDASVFCLFVKDRNNYSNAIAGAVAIVLYFVAGLQLFVGVALEGAVYRFGFLAWIFIIVGVIQGLIALSWSWTSLPKGKANGRPTLDSRACDKMVDPDGSVQGLQGTTCRPCCEAL